MGADASGFEQLVAEHHAGVLRICRSILRDDHLGADAAQETFLRLWRNALGGALPEQVGAWLRRVAVHAAIDLARRQPASDPRSEARPAGHDPGPAPAAIDSARARELRATLDDAVRRLPEGQRTIFLLRHEAGMRIAEVADSLGVAPATVKTQFARACLKLQSRLVAFRPADERP